LTEIALFHESATDCNPSKKGGQKSAPQNNKEELRLPTERERTVSLSDGSLLH